MAQTPGSAGALAHESPKAFALFTWADSSSPEDQIFIHWLRRCIRVILICFREMNANVLTVRAGYLTYAILLSMVPMLAMSTAVVKGLGGGDQLREVVYTYVDSLEHSTGADSAQQTPAPEKTADPESSAKTAGDMIGHLRSAVDKIFDYVDRTNFATLGTFGMVGILFSVIMVLGQVEKSLNVIWKVANGRSFLRKVADYLALMILMPISLNVALAAGTMLGSQSLNVHVDRYLPIDWIQTLLLKGVPVVILSFTLYIVYIFFPNTKTQGKATMIGALVAGTAWFITQNVYISMQIGVAKYNAIYGSFATIPLFLAWVWVGCLFVLIGAQIGYSIQAEPGYRFIPGTPRPSLQISAALDICNLVSRRFHDMQPVSRVDILERCSGYDSDILEDVLQGLIENGILHHKADSDELMPSLPTELMTSRKVVETVLGEDMPDTPGGRTTVQAMSGMVASFPENADLETEKATESEKTEG